VLLPCARVVRQRRSRRGARKETNRRQVLRVLRVQLPPGKAGDDVRLLRAILFTPPLLAGAAIVLVGGAIFALADRWNAPALGVLGFAIVLPGAALAFVGHLGIGG
jgi:hypothetical protein